MLPKISTRAQKPDPPSNTIPLNIPVKPKRRPATSPPSADAEKPASVLSSLSEEDLIRKAAEMLGESGGAEKPATPTGGAKKPAGSLPVFSPNIPPPSVPPAIPPPNVPPPFIYSTPPPAIVAPPPAAAAGATPTPGAKRSKLDLPPVPGLEDET